MGHSGINGILVDGKITFVQGGAGVDTTLNTQLGG